MRRNDKLYLLFLLWAVKSLRKIIAACIASLVSAIFLIRDAGNVATKAGLFTTLLILLKTFGVFIVVGIGALLGKLLKRNKS